MTQRARDFYRSSNGDRWSLVHDLDSGRVFIRHEPNMSSGGQTSETTVGDFLVRDAHGPEHAVLLKQDIGRFKRR
jgi:hypothetical protein